MKASVYPKEQDRVVDIAVAPESVDRKAGHQNGRARLLFAIVAVAVVLVARVALGADSNVDPSESEEIGPLVSLGLIAIVALIGLLVVAMGVVLALILCAVVGVLLLAGILSTSVAVGIVRRNPAAGLRVLFIQVGAVFGAVCGTVVAWLLPGQGPAALLAGAVAGFFFGGTLGVLFNRVWGRAASRFLARFDVGQ